MKALFVLLAFSISNLSYGAVQFDSDVPVNIRSQITRDLAVTKTFQGNSASEIYRQIFGDNTLAGGGLVRYFNNRIQQIGMDSCGGGTMAAACVMGGPKMWLTPNYVTSNLPQLFRISIVLHEARHTEGWMHAVCPIPYLDEDGKDIVGIISGAKMEGTESCDENVLGSYGLEAVFLKNVERHCDTCSEKMKQDGQLFGDDVIKRISNISERKRLREDLNN